MSEGRLRASCGMPSIVAFGMNPLSFTELEIKEFRLITITIIIIVIMVVTKAANISESLQQ